MNAKTRLDASPNVIYLQDLLDEWLGAGRARVILPITDPYVVHHGALGSYATVYLARRRMSPALVSARIAALRGIEVVLIARARRPRRFELPADRIGDLVVVVHALGRTRQRGGQARSVGSRCAAALARRPVRAAVPLIINRRIADLDANRRWRNFDAFDWVLNHAH